MAWLELLRPPNLPTIASNAVLGVWLGMLTQGRRPGLPGTSWNLDSWSPTFDGGDLATLARIVGALSGFYLVGLILNDVFDLDVDRRERPHRPLPSGRIRVGHAVAAAIAIWVASLWSIGGFAGEGERVDVPVLVLSLLLTALILAYDLLHTRVSWAVVLPALCRGLAIVLAALAATRASGGDASTAWVPWQGIDWVVVLGPAGVVAIFVFSVSLVARREIADDGGRACAECGTPVPPAATEAGRVVRAGELGRRPWWVVASGVPCLLPAIGFGALLPLVVGASAGGGQLLRDAATLLAFGAWFWTATRWNAEMPVPRLVGRWLGSLCLLDAVMLAPHGPAPLAICLGLHAAGRVLARRFAGS